MPRFKRTVTVEAIRLMQPITILDGDGKGIEGNIGDWLVTSNGQQSIVTDHDLRAQYKPIGKDATASLQSTK